MTVLVHFESLGIAISDVLMSIDKKGGGIRLPSIGLPEDANRDLPIRPTSLVRKFFRVKRPGSSGIFLLCGTGSHIQEVIKNVEDLISGKSLPPAELSHKYVQNNVSSLVDIAAFMTEGAGKNEFELLGYVDGISFLRHFPQTISQQLPYWGSVIAMGSGSRDLIEWLDQKGKSYEAHGLESEDSHTKALRALNAVPSLLLEEDTRGMQTLKEGVGGYYESYMVGHGTLTPQDNVLTIFGRFKSTHVFELRRIFFHHYDDDTLVIGSLHGLPVEISDSEPIKLPLDSMKVFHVEPFGVTSQILWNSSRLAIMLNSAETMRLTTYRGSKDESIKRFYEGAGKQRLLTFHVTGNNLQLTLNATLFKYYLSRSDNKVAM